MTLLSPQAFERVVATVLRVYNPANPEDLIKIWYQYFKHLGYQELVAAFDEHIRKSKYVPKPCEIFSIVERRQAVNRPWVLSEEEAFERAQKLIRPIDQPLYDKLSTLVGDQSKRQRTITSVYDCIRYCHQAHAEIMIHLMAGNDGKVGESLDRLRQKIQNTGQS